MEGASWPSKYLNTKDIMHLKTQYPYLKYPAILCVAFSLSVGLRAQSSTPPPAAPTTTTTTTTTMTPTTSSSSSTASGAEGEKVTTLEAYTVSDVPISEQILPTVRPIDSVYGDRNLFCTCPPIEEFAS